VEITSDKAVSRQQSAISPRDVRSHDFSGWLLIVYSVSHRKLQTYKVSIVAWRRPRGFVLLNLCFFKGVIRNAGDDYLLLTVKLPATSRQFGGSD